MGQQQLLLILLGTVLTGLAIAAAISVYANMQHQRAVDGLKQEAVVIGTDAQAWFGQPAPKGAGAHAADG